MTDEPQRYVVLATLVLLALVGLTALALAPTAAADSHENDSSYVIEQGDQCIDVDPIVDESQSAESFYDYRHPDSDPSATTYSSYGTLPYQKDNASTLMLYEGSEGTSLVIVHERLHDPAESGTNGSSATFVVDGLSPEDDGWVVEDDEYDGRDDNFDHGDTRSEIDWVWAQGRTDGGVYRGLDGDFEIGIDPAFNEEADQRYSTPSYTGMVHDWDVVTATEDGHERVTLDSLQDSVTISPGHCAAAPTADLTAGDAEPAVGQSVTFDASGSQSETDVAEYRWDLTGDGEIDRTTQDPTTEHAFETPGEQTVTVTVVTTDGQTDAASTTVDVADDTPPTAAIDAPDEAAAGQSITLSGADSADDDRIESYDWTIEDGSASGETVQHAFEDPGEYTVELTVTDPAGNEDTATTTVSVTEADGPAASLDAPATATTEETVTLDASGSVTGENVSYEWTVDGETATTTDPAYEHSFAAAGEYQVAVTVSDANGSDTAQATIDVAEPLAASVEAAPTEATVGEPVAFDAGNSTGVAAYDWSLGDGTTIEDGSATTEHAYEEAGTYEATVTVRDGDGTTDTATVTIDVTAADDSGGPTAQLDVPAEASLDEEVTLDASGSEAGDDASYVWVVDGESVATTTDPTYDHSFAAAGDHEVAVTVSDASGDDEAEASVTVTESLSASLEATPESAGLREAIEFDASGSTGDVVAYDWTFGDDTGLEDDDAVVVHGYEDPGSYDVTVTVRNGSGATDTETVTVDVSEDGASGPTAKLDAPDETTVGEAVKLDASGSVAGDDASYEWKVDGETATTSAPTYEHTFAAAGEYEVAVTVSDANGTDEATAKVSVVADDGNGGDDGSNGDDGSSGDEGSDDDSGSSGGYGGGYSPSPTEPDESVETDVELTDGAIVVTATNVEAGESFSVDVPRDDSAADTAGNDSATTGAAGAAGDVVELRSLEITAAEDADEATITVEPADRDVPGRFAPTSAFEPDATVELESVTYDVAADRDVLAAAGVSADELTAYAEGDAWNPRETSVETADDRYLASATVDGNASVGVGAVGPVMYVSDVATDGPTADGEVSLATTVENTGSDAGEWTLPVAPADEPVDERSIELAPGEERTVRTDAATDDVADGGVRVAGHHRDPAVATVTDLSVTPSEPAPDESATVEATVVNHGGAGEVAVDLHRDGEVVATNAVELDAGEETTVAFEQTFAGDGSYELAVGNATTSVSVDERDNFDDESSEVTSDATPGPGVLAALGALLAVAVIAVHRGRR